MKVRILACPGDVRPHTVEGDIVESTVSSEGELSVTAEDRDGNSTGWVTYARGQWLSVELLEAPDPEIFKYVAERLEAERGRRSYHR
ncbi:hypothetical protein ACQEUV_26650 [Micromonospora aurantiaca (nom. illeg.)]|uniref:hypothetical protein n=1 Tax=Micromonospora aurantiaca (nom. illeg.) TaxID=47850 RepID=UPI003DA46605